MRYAEFKIYNYKGITSPVTIKIGKDNQLIPIIGVNECGKTTILEAIYAFRFGYQFRDNKDFDRYIVKSYNCLHQLDFKYPDLIKISATIAFDEDNPPYTLSQLIKKIIGEDFFIKNPPCNLEKHNTLTIMKCVHKNYFNDIPLNYNRTTDSEVFKKNLSDNIRLIEKRMSPEHRKDFRDADFLEDIHTKLKDIFLSIHDSSKSGITYTIEDDWVKYLTREQYKKIIYLIEFYLPPIIYFDDFSYSIPSNNENIPLDLNTLSEEFEKDQKKRLESCAPLKKREKIITDLTNRQSDVEPYVHMIENIINSVYRNFFGYESKIHSSKEEYIWQSPTDEEIEQVNQKVNDILDKKFTQYWQSNDKPERGKLDFFYNKEKYSARLRYLEKRNGQEMPCEINLRSKGFQWFLDFVLKTEFLYKETPKEYGFIKKRALLLFDEPEQYLHNSMQKVLVKKLKELSKDYTIIYTSHSPNMLGYEGNILPNIHVSYKDPENDFSIALKTSDEYIHKQKTGRKVLAFEPIYQILGVNVFESLFLYLNKFILIVEGKLDSILFGIFKTYCHDEISFLPGKGADCNKYLATVLNVNKKMFLLLYDEDGDNDNKTGRKACDKFNKLFPNKGFTTLDIAKDTEGLKDKSMNTLEDLYDENEYQKVIDEHYPDLKFEKNEQTAKKKKDLLKNLTKKLFEEKSEQRKKIIDRDMKQTKQNVTIFLKEIYQRFEKHYPENIS